METLAHIGRRVDPSGFSPLAVARATNEGGASGLCSSAPRDRARACVSPDDAQEGTPEGMTILPCAVPWYLGSTAASS